MSIQNDLSDFLTTRRAKLTLADVGLPDLGGRRRVPGLRREEVAFLAGMSAEYYKRLERGNATGVSASIVSGVSRALQLDEAERTHLEALVRAANAGVRHERGRCTRTNQITPAMRQTIEAISTVPVFIQNGHLDLVGANQLGRALFAGMMDGESPANSARITFLHPDAQTFYPDWQRISREIVAVLRAEAGRSPNDQNLSNLVDELLMRSERFRELWGAHDVVEHRTGIKRIHHPIVGDLELTYQSMDLASDRDLRMQVYSAAPESASYERLQLLANWSNTAETDTASQLSTRYGPDTTAEGS